MLVNYVWISKEGVKAGEPPVPLLSLERAFQNARRYPDAPFVVWVDQNALCGQGKKSLRDIFNAHAPDNMVLHDLQDIPFYRSCTLFHGNQTDIWGKVDLARLVAMEHCFSTVPQQTIIYSDFDVDDVALNNPEVLSRLEKYGMVFGASEQDYLENGYMGFDKKGATFLIERLIPATIINVRTGKDGYAAMMGELQDLAKENGFNKYDLGVEMLHPYKYKIEGEPKLDYSRFGIVTGQGLSL